MIIHELENIKKKGRVLNSKAGSNKLVRAKMRPKEGAKIELLRKICQICQICRFRFVRFADFRDLKKTRDRRTDGRTNGPTDGRTDGWTDPLIEIPGCI